MTVPPPPFVDPTPPPPPGPGVVVPFAAPPRDRDQTRLVVGIVLAVVLAVVLCGGLVGGLGVIATWTNAEMSQRAEVVAGRFLDDVVEEDYPAAYRSTCESYRRSRDVETFVDEWRTRGVRSYVLGQVVPDSNGDLIVDARVTTTGGDRPRLPLIVRLDGPDNTLAVCGW